ncbi:unnamed protein product [Symbiodinium sp. CCMP2592]|nr:unnamed protein product [Symbiodinium sp. CCMP2592]
MTQRRLLWSFTRSTGFLVERSWPSWSRSSWCLTLCVKRYSLSCRLLPRLSPCWLPAVAEPWPAHSEPLHRTPLILSLPSERPEEQKMRFPAWIGFSVVSEPEF